MNILYIGPYRLNNSIGYESLNILLDLNDYCSTVVARPIYNKTPINKLEDIEPSLTRIEATNVPSIDIIIQHLDIDSIVYTSKVSKYIYIPIIDQVLPNKYQIEKYNFINQHGIILYKNNIEKYILEYSGIKNIEKLDININAKLSKPTRRSFNFGLYNTYQKYYSVIDGLLERHIKDLIINFITSFHKDNKCLILFVQHMTQSMLDNYNVFIKNVYATLKINFSINKIILAPVELNNDIIRTIHNTGDIYIDLVNDVHLNYATKYNKAIISNTSDIILGHTQDNLSEQPTASFAHPLCLFNNTVHIQSRNIIDFIKNYV